MLLLFIYGINMFPHDVAHIFEIFWQDFGADKIKIKKRI